jgi:hypothetical protein
MFFMLGYSYMFIPKIVKQVICICTLFLNCFALRCQRVHGVALRQGGCGRGRACRIWTPRIWRSARDSPRNAGACPQSLPPSVQEKLLDIKVDLFSFAHDWINSLEHYLLDKSCRSLCLRFLTTGKVDLFSFERRILGSELSAKTLYCCLLAATR